MKDDGCRISVDNLKSRYKQNNRSEYLIVKTTKKVRSKQVLPTEMSVRIEVIIGTGHF